MKIAAIRVRGEVRKSPNIVDTLKTLNLNHKNHCVILEDTPVSIGMLRTVCGYVTWGELAADLEKELIEKRGKDKNQTVFKLSPPKGGFGRSGIRKYYKMQGACGNRGKDFEKLLRRMI